MINDFIFGVKQRDVIYDIETYPNIFTFAAQTPDGRRWFFERSETVNDLHQLCEFMDTLAEHGCRMIGFNNIGFDYPVLHFIYQMRYLSAEEIYTKAMSIIFAPHNQRFAHMIWDNDRIVEQVDLFKIHHFDNVAKATSLKILEFNMRSLNVEDLPFEPGTVLTAEEMEVLRKYNWNDVTETLNFYRESLDQIRFREELTAKYGRDFMNHNDTKIGKDYFIMRLEENRQGSCYQRVDGRRHMVQTIRERIRLADVIIPYIRFNDPEFTRILQWFKEQTITETKGVFTGISCTVRGFQFVFGTGGIHGSVESQVIASDDEWVIESRDVKSYYPNLAIVNRFYPEHLGETFCDIYRDMYLQRQTYPKGSAENAMLKLALNGTYGDSNNKYSPFYDPQFTMSITINGQLLLCMLAEQLMKVPGLQMLMINTDGLEYRVQRCYVEHINKVCEWWENLTGLELESDVYKKLCIRDCNNYIGVYEE